MGEEDDGKDKRRVSAEISLWKDTLDTKLGDATKKRLEFFKTGKLVSSGKRFLGSQPVFFFFFLFLVFSPSFCFW